MNSLVREIPIIPMNLKCIITIVKYSSSNNNSRICRTLDIWIIILWCKINPNFQILVVCLEIVNN